MNTKQKHNKWDIVIAALCFVLAIGAFIWITAYERETIRMHKEAEQEIQALKNKVEENRKYIESVDYQLNYLQDEVPEFLVPGDKASVDSTIDAYYREHPMAAPLQTKTGGAATTTQKAAQKTTQKKAEVDPAIHIQLNDIVEYIKEKEKFKSKAYRDGCLVKVQKGKECPTSKVRYSVGYGTLAKSRTETITQIEAERRLTAHIKQTIYPKLVGVKFKSVAQMHASIDFAYNAGQNAFANNVVTSNKEVDCVKMTEYIVFEGKENEGLRRRRFENFVQCLTIEG